MSDCHICGREVVPAEKTVRRPSCECHLQMAVMEAALDQLVSLYVKNKGTDGEYIACITPEHRKYLNAKEIKGSECWKAWDDARRALGETP